MGSISQHNILFTLQPDTIQQKPIIMKVLIALMALVVVAAALTEEEEMEAEIAFIKRDPVLQDYFMAEKRGKSMRKYKVCAAQFSDTQTCWCSRRTGKFSFCAGSAGGENM